jgi:hypothetical protein
MNCIEAGPGSLRATHIAMVRRRIRRLTACRKASLGAPRPGEANAAADLLIQGAGAPVGR